MNDSIMPSSDLAQLAYRLLKQDACYDKMGCSCTRMSPIEASDLFLKRQDILATIV